MAEKEVKVPDIGNFKDVEVIEVMVKPGDVVAKEQGLITTRDRQGCHGRAFALCGYRESSES